MTRITDYISFIVIALIGCQSLDTASAQDFYLYYVVPDVWIKSGSSLLQSFTNITNNACSSWCSVIPQCFLAQHFYQNNSCQLHQLQGFQSSSAEGNAAYVKLSSSVTKVDPSYRALVGLLVLGGQTDGPRNYALDRVASAPQCQQLCEALTCGFFAYNSIKQLCFVCPMDFYDSWTNATDQDQSWTSYYKKRPGSSKLLMKVSAGSGIDISNFFFSSTAFNGTASSAQMSQYNTNICFIKNQIIKYWLQFNLSKIHLTYATQGRISAFVTFNAIGATQNNFFSLSRILNSSWTDLTAATSDAKYFVLGTPTSNWYGRYFVIASAWSSCSSDVLWTATTGPSPYGCNYDKGRMPVFAYMPTSTRGHLAISGAFAEAMLLYGEL